jgi:hypothetical protein
MIIGINGKIGSGKDTVGNLIKNINCENNWEIKKFATKVKEIATLITGIPMEKFEDQDFKNTFLNTHWNKEVFENKTSIDKNNNAYNKSIVKPMTIREMLQIIGTDALRNNLHQDVWVNALFADYKQTWNDPDPIPDNDYTITWRENYTDETTLIHYGKGSEAEVFEYEINNPNWIITDLRFPNEYEAIKSREGITIRVVKPDNKKVSSDLHPSETALDDAEFDYEIVNDGTLEDLKDKVEGIILHINLNK